MKKYPPSKKTLQHALSLLSTCIVNICAIQTNNYKNQVVANLEKPNFLIVMLVWKIDKCSSQEKDIHEQLSMTKHPQTRGLLINCFVGTEEGLLSEMTDKRALLVRKTLFFSFSNPRAICIAYSAFCPSRHKKSLFRKSIANV